jgi:hypothetical protein
MALVNARVRPREQTYELKSLEGAWVTIRRFNHGERIDRLGKILVMGFGDDETTGQATINYRAARLHDFGNAITDHNLGDGNGRKFDLTKPDDVFELDPTVGDEIDELIQAHQEVIPESEIPKSEENSSSSTSTHIETGPETELEQRSDIPQSPSTP